MSSWTYIHGTVTVSPYGRTQAEKRYILETVLAHLPKVTGSEENMYTHIVQHAGTNSSAWEDEFGITQDDSVETQDYYSIVVEGHFRDRFLRDTFQEFMKWIQRLCKRVWTTDVTIKISSDSGRTIFIDWGYMQCVSFFEDYSWLQRGTVNWCEYLIWREPHDENGNLLRGKPDFADGACIDMLTPEEKAKRLPIKKYRPVRW